MNKKLQVFISSTYIDLQEERQAAVEAILNAGHIPAGMELFKAGNETQLDTIKRWIDQSDVYMLILGGRYGSIENKSGKSYAHIEYEYAINRKIPVFALILEDEAIDKKVATMGKSAIERENLGKYEEFKKQIMSKICKLVSDDKDIKLAILETLNEFQHLYKFTGWVSGKEIPNVDGLIKEISRLTKENERLKKIEVKEKELTAKFDNTYNGFGFEEIVNKMKATPITFPAKVINKPKDFTISLLDFFLNMKSTLTVGVTNAYNASEFDTHIYYSVAPELVVYGFMEKVKVSGVVYERIQISKLGHKFLMEYLLREGKSKLSSEKSS